MTLTARANNRGDPVHSCHISFSVMLIIVASARFCLWGDKDKDRLKTANTFLQTHIWQYWMWINIANIYRLLSALQPASTDPKLSAKYSLFVNDTSYCWCCVSCINSWCTSPAWSVTGFIGDSAVFSNRFCDSSFNSNLAQNQTANSKTSSDGHLPRFWELSVS